jgi:hypothetical protein
MRFCIRSSDPIIPVSKLLKSCANAAGELADRFHLLRLPELLLGAAQALLAASARR